jgi:hypothetical protein
MKYALDADAVFRAHLTAYAPAAIFSISTYERDGKACVRCRLIAERPQ